MAKNGKKWQKMAKNGKKFRLIYIYLNYLKIRPYFNKRGGGSVCMIFK